MKTSFINLDSCFNFNDQVDTDKQNKWISNLQKGALAVFLSQKFSKDTDQKSLLVILEQISAAETLFGDLCSLIGDDKVYFFPALDQSPYEWRESFGQVREQRLSAMDACRSGRPVVVVTTMEAQMERLPRPQLFARDILKLSVGMELPLEDMRSTLTHLGFVEEPVVEDIGEFAMRGGILDIFPFGRDFPIRLEWFGDTIDTIREFEVFSQRSQNTLSDISIWPMTEWCFNGREIEDALLKNSKMFSSDDAFIAESYRLMEKGERVGLNWQKPFFTKCDAHLRDYFSNSVEVYYEAADQLDRACVIDNDSWEHGYIEAQEKGLWVASPEQLFFSAAEVRVHLEKQPSIGAVSIQIDLPSYHHFNIEHQQPGQGGWSGVRREFEDYKSRNYHITVLAANEGQAERLKQIIQDYPVDEICIAKLSCGFISHDDKWLCYTDHQIANRFQKSYAFKGYKGGTVSIPHFESLNKGDLIVHQDYGLGQFVGIKRILVEGCAVDCLLLAYKGSGKLTIPVAHLAKIQKYSSKEGASVQLSPLGGTTWEAQKARVKKSVQKLAQDLLELYARRQAIQGFAFPPDGELQAEFEAAFDYTPTPDQTKAAKEAKKDMERAQPMDRLICGDVGFGKTEVAMRAAFKAVCGKKQVAILAPTTLLVSQHYSSFVDRMSNWPVRIEYLNRFRTTKEEKEILQATKEGKVDILIGTHRLLSGDVFFADLGLMVIDEEQKFGVQQKEKLKKLRADVDVLSMSATPIPRSLYMSMMGARDFSVIMTPPRNRLPIDTRVMQWRDDWLKEAIQREIHRGGQCFFVHPRVEDLGLWVQKLELLVPSARICAAHGQMPEKDLERVMGTFIRREADILVATTIIESGIDLPNVNTIMINEAHHFGLSQLFQLRGRVGRSATQAYCLLLAPPEDRFTDEAKKRLYSLQKYTELGSGYQLAMKDLEIRGAGNILGTEQSGHIVALGFDTYCALLKEAMLEIQGKPVVPEIEPELELPISAFIPESYVTDGMQRIATYQKLSDCSTEKDVDDLHAEVRDRFGPVPEEMENLLYSMRCRILCKAGGFARLKIKDGQLHLWFAASRQPPVNELAPMAARCKQPLRFFNEVPLRIVIDFGKKKLPEQLTLGLESLRGVVLQ